MKKQANSSELTGQQIQGQPMSSIGGGPVGGISRGQLFPAKLALALGMAKTLLGVLLVAFGALALWEQASMSYLGSGELSSYIVDEKSWPVFIWFFQLLNKATVAKCFPQSVSFLFSVSHTIIILYFHI